MATHDASLPACPGGASGVRPGSGAMFDRIARRYDLINLLMTGGLDRLWRRRAVKALALGSESRVLDLATGTADVALAVAEHHGDAEVVGLDPSTEMLDIGRGKVTKAGADRRIRLEEGEAEALPYDDDSFDGVTISFGIRNVGDRDAGLREMARVTRPGGRVVILEGTEPRAGLLGWPSRFYMHHVIPRIGGWLSRQAEYRYLQSSIEAFPAPKDFARQMERCGLEVLEVRPMTFGVCCLFVARPAATADAGGEGGAA
ncbi:MAG: bifunctional demethylmenaquinone methyltransferase/2-methoxy-6-polyprenyl-1,4-benzoquinol methylase UbiE [Acidobacteriota bacterium]